MLNMARLQVLCGIQIMQYRTRGYHPLRQVVHAETFEVLHIKLLHQSLARRLASHHPIVQLKGEILIAKRFLKIAFLTAQIKHLFGREVHQEFIHIILGAFCHQVFARRYIQKGYTHRLFGPLHTSEPCVLALL